MTIFIHYVLNPVAYVLITSELPRLSYLQKRKKAYRLVRASRSRAKRVLLFCFFNKAIKVVKKRNGNNGNKNKAGFCTLFFLNESSLSSNPAKRGKIKNLYLNDKISFISSMYRLVKNKAGFCTLFEILRP